MKKKILFQSKRYTKNKNYLRKKRKYYNDQKFLRKYKKKIQPNETKTELVNSDPIKNFFFTPSAVEHKQEKVKEEQKEKEMEEPHELLEEQIAESQNKTRSYGSGNKKTEWAYNNKEIILLGQQKHNMKQKTKKKSAYIKELNITEMKKKEKELSVKEKEAAILKSEKERTQKKLMRFQKFIKLNQKTSRGQPVMKNIISHLLKKI
ncbi:conserved Plasmodium protein, unknown function [Plasmodium malariae]|uniref:Uncharacterized protein n=1 Tax=Plasmodium malariae TaxID=5858 RepID=A0A1C3L2X3_PLAMA|nr:conserved Plasmodium protein, unknown function [Plasmodium malariae]SBT80931.1 conserved Plasmodium protein, unknown function [Plasmodium malariae]SCP03537.1 conserved Plasmodium protein, unknown function [Plasmodium malariae]